MDYYYAVILRAEEGEYVAMFPDFPEIATQGKTVAECVYMAKDALELVMRKCILENDTLPEASDFEKITEKAKTIFSEQPYLDKTFAPLVQAIITEDMSQKPVKVTVSFPKGYLQDIDKKAEKLGMTRSGFLVKAALAYE